MCSEGRQKIGEERSVGRHDDCSLGKVDRGECVLKEIVSRSCVVKLSHSSVATIRF